MTQITEYFTQHDFDNPDREDNYGRYSEITKSFDGVNVKHTHNSMTGCFLHFTGLKTSSDLLLNVDGDRINEVTHLILQGNKAIGEAHE